MGLLSKPFIELFAQRIFLKSRFEDQILTINEALTRVLDLAKKVKNCLGDTERRIDPKSFKIRQEKNLSSS